MVALTNGSQHIASEGMMHLKGGGRQAPPDGNGTDRLTKPFYCSSSFIGHLGKTNLKMHQADEEILLCCCHNGMSRTRTVVG